MKYEIHDKEPEFKPFSVTLTFEGQKELEQFEAFTNSSSAMPGELWRAIRNRLKWAGESHHATFDCTITPIHKK